MRIIKITIFLLLVNGQLFAQSNAANVFRLIPPSPTAASLAKFQDIPVSYYTGVPNISIPLYHIKSNNLEVPISLNYHTGGIRVEEEASWVGLGWSLTSGGAITRVVRGLDDLPYNSTRGYPDSYLPTSIDQLTNKYIIPSNTTQRQYDESFLNNVVDGLEDTEPDIFVFNFNGRSGKFILKKRSSVSSPLEPVLISQEDIKISVQYVAAKANYEWTITDEGGAKYVFGTVERTVSRSGSGEDEESADVSAPEGLPSDVVSTWYLDKIVSPEGAEIGFVYAASNPTGRGTKRILSRSQVKKHVTELHATSSCTVPMNEYAYLSTYTEIRDVYLSSIIFPNGKIDFKLSNRTDIEPVSPASNPTYAKKVDEIILLRGTGSNLTPVRKYIFTYGYFGATLDYGGKRLTLLSVVENSILDNKSLPPYTFKYNALELPEKDSKAIDHWGYYNGSKNNIINDNRYGDHSTHGTLVPPYSMYIPEFQQTREFLGADREPKGNFAQACILTDIKYPDGGNTRFDFESNEYYQPSIEVEDKISNVFLEKFGLETNVPNRGPDTCIVELSSPGKVLVTSSVQCYNGNSCLQYPGMEYEYDVVSIRSLPGTPYLNQGIGYLLTTENQELSVTKETELDLPAGRYKFTVQADQNYLSRMWIEWSGGKDTTYIYNHFGGGLRVKKMITSGGATGDLVTNFSYSKVKDGMTISTGNLMTTPEYNYMEDIRKGCETSVYEITAKAVVRTSSSVIPFSNAAQGNSVGYDEVTVWKEGQGKTVYQYLNVKDKVSYPQYPNVPTTAYIGNGLLSKETVFAQKADGSFKKVKEIGRKYLEDLQREKQFKAMKVPTSDAARYILNGSLNPYYNNVKFYDLYSEWMYLAVDTLRNYSQIDDTYSEIITNYAYTNPNWLQITEKAVKNSRGESLKTTYKYPYDFLSTGVYQQMVNKNQVKFVIEEANYLGNMHLQTTRTNYAIWTNNMLLPSSIEKKVNNSAFKVEHRFLSYSNKGLLLAESKDMGPIFSYVWSYGEQYPVAEIRNAAYATVQSVLGAGLTSFTASVPTDATVRSFLAPLRTHASLKDAAVMIYTYDLMNGISSATAPSGRTTYYSYDGFGRLQTVKDTEQKTKETFDYNYRNQ